MQQATLANVSGTIDQHCIAIDQGPSAEISRRIESGTDPPSYEEVINPYTTSPPSYESLFGRAKEARHNSKGVLDFIKNLIVLVLGTIGCTAVLVGTMVIPVAMILMGSLYIYRCPQEENIPVYLLIAGLLGVLKQLLHLYEYMRRTNEDDLEGSKRKPIHSYLEWFMCFWFLRGSCWVYGLFEPNFDPAMGPYCDKTLYMFAYWLITFTYIFFALLIAGVCSLAIFSSWRTGSPSTALAEGVLTRSRREDIENYSKLQCPPTIVVGEEPII